jgi:ligand-binding sensor domain-containing protein/two-component sensor histidine kinase
MSEPVYREVTMFKFFLKKSICLFIGYCCILCIPSFINAQGQPVSNTIFHSIGLNEGLSQGMVNSILQDRYGFMWFASKDGLNRYDGTNFKIYRHDPEDTTSIADSYVSSLLEDSKGRLWTGAASGSIDLFDHRKGRFEHILQTGGQKENSSISSVIQIAEDKQGRIWVLSFDQVFILTENRKQVEKKFTVEKLALPYKAVVPFLFFSNDGEIYFNDKTRSGTFYFDAASHQWKEMKLLDEFFVPLLQKQPGIFDLIEDTHSPMLYAFCSNGIYAIAKNSVPKRIFEFTFNNLVQAFIANDGQLIFFNKEFVWILDPATHQTTLLSSADMAIKTQLGMLNILYQDRNDLVWIGTKGYGILTLDIHARRFHHTDKSSIYHLYELQDGRILVNNKKVLDRFSGAYTDSTVSQDLIKESSTLSIRSHDNKYWTTDDKNLLCLDPVTKRTDTFLLPVKQLNFTYGLVNAMIEDTEKNLWLGSTEGLLFFDKQKATWKIFRNKPSDPNSLSFNAVFSLCKDPVDPANYLWVGTNGGGLNKFDLHTEKFTRYSLKDGLPNDVIYGILPDNNKRLWMSTNKGLSCFDPVKNRFKNFEEKDGLQNNEFNHGAYLRTRDGMLIFGGVTGFNYFDPKEIIDNPVIPKIVITGLKIRNRSVESTDKNSCLDSAIYLTKNITLPYSDNMLSFEFASMDFSAPQKNLYKYKLDGFDKEWINAGTIHSATYTNLDPGTYTFTVKGTNKDGVWNEEGTSIRLTILPPWYKTWWFRILVILIIGGAIYAIYKYRLNQALKVHAIRNSIARDLHDEIGSNLSNISIFSEVAQQQKGTANETQPILKKISEYSQVSMTAMSDIVWMINARNDSFENIISRMRSLAAEIFEAKNYNLHLYFDEQLNQLSLNMEQRKNFYLIYKEAINNVAKYADCKNVWINLKREGNTIKLTVKDDGIGFNAEKQNKGNGLFNMEKRAETLKGNLMVNSQPNEGTTVELIFNC